MPTPSELFKEADDHVAKAIALRKEASRLHDEELKAKPIAERLVYAATARCLCGAGMAYDPVAVDENSVFVGALSNFWGCSAILLGTADPAVKHTDKLPFAFWNLKSETQPSAGGATTRAKAE